MFPSSIDPKEIENFEKLAHHWWDVEGPYKPLHDMTPARLHYIVGTLREYFGRQEGRKPFTDLEILDVGCGGGLISEPLARLGAQMTGIDAGQANILSAQQHACQQNLPIHYRVASVEELVQEGKRYDGLIVLEVIEHVVDPEAFVRHCAHLLKEKGVMIFSTLNRTVHSFIKAIVAAEYILRWLPVGTHQWNKFVRPRELREMVQKTGLSPGVPQGLTFHPLTRAWELSPNTAVNYFLAAYQHK